MSEILQDKNTEIKDTKVDIDDKNENRDSVVSLEWSDLLNDLDEMDELNEVVLNKQQRGSINSWFKMVGNSKHLIKCYAGMLIGSIVFALSSTGMEGEWLWAKISLTILGSALVLFIATVIRLMIYSGKPNQNLKNDLLDVDDEEKIVTANNFYLMIVKTMLVPTITVMVAYMAIQNQIAGELLIGDTLAISTVLIAIPMICSMSATFFLIYLYVYLRLVKKDNKEIEIKIQGKHENSHT